MLAAIGPKDYVVALEVKAKSMSTEGLSAWFAERMQGGRPVAMLIGGPDGLAPACRERADQAWSLSPLTLPHGAGARAGRRAALPGHEPARRASLPPRLSVIRSLSSSAAWVSDLVYLASGSPRRRELLEQIGVPFRILALAIDESVAPAESAARVCLPACRGEGERGLRLGEARPATRSAGARSGYGGGARRRDPGQARRPRGRAAHARGALGSHPRGVDGGRARLGARAAVVPQPQRGHVPRDRRRRGAGVLGLPASPATRRADTRYRAGRGFRRGTCAAAIPASWGCRCTRPRSC